MKIHNKHNIGDVVYFMRDNKITHSKIFQITIYVKEWSIDLMYYLEISRNEYYYENSIFKTKEDLVKAL